MWAMLMPLLISAGVEVVKVAPKIVGKAGLKEMMPSEVRKWALPAISVVGGIVTGEGLFGEAAAQATGGAVSGAGMGVAAVGVHSIVKNVLQAVKVWTKT